MKALHFGGGCYVPREIAECPECGGELTARSMAWDEKTGRPIGSAIQVDCVKDPNGRHRWHQSDWQPVLDTIRKWGGAIHE